MVRRTSTIAPALLVSEGGQSPLQLGDRAVDGGEVLRRAGRQGTVELGERARGGKAVGPLDQRSLQLAPQVALELVEAFAIQRQRLAVAVGLRAALDLEAERAPDPLYVHADHSRPLAAAPEGRDREPCQVSHLPVAAFGYRLAHGVAELVEIDLPAGLVALPDPPAQRLRLGGAKEEAVEEQIEDAAVLLRLRQRRRHRLAEVGGLGPGHVAERRECVEDLGGSDAQPRATKLLAERHQPGAEAGREPRRLLGACAHPRSLAALTAGGAEVDRPGVG
jgi:hypothetical protein